MGKNVKNLRMGFSGPEYPPFPPRLELLMEDLEISVQNIPLPIQDWNFLWWTLWHRLVYGDYRCIHAGYRLVELCENGGELLYFL